MTQPNKKHIEIFLANRRLLKGVAYRYAPEKSYLDDIMQQVFLELLKKSQITCAAEDVVYILMGMTKNIALRCWREKTRNLPHVLRQIADSIQQKSIEQADETYEDEIRIMNECIKSLPSDQQSMIKMYHFDHCPVKDIAERMGMKPRNVYTILMRIREKLKSAITRRIKEENRDV